MEYVLNFVYININCKMCLTGCTFRYYVKLACIFIALEFYLGFISKSDMWHANFYVA